MIARRPCGVGSMVGEVPHQLGPSRVVAEHRFAPAVHAHDVRRPLERAPHQRDATVFAEVGDRLGVAAGEVEIGHGDLVDDSERAAQPLRREVDGAVAGEGSRTREENVLGLDEGAQPAVDVLVDLSHARIMKRRTAAAPPLSWKLPHAERLHPIVSVGLTVGAQHLGVADQERRALHAVRHQAAWRDLAADEDTLPDAELPRVGRVQQVDDAALQEQQAGRLGAGVDGAGQRLRARRYRLDDPGARRRRFRGVDRWRTSVSATESGWVVTTPSTVVLTITARTRRCRRRSGGGGFGGRVGAGRERTQAEGGDAPGGDVSSHTRSDGRSARLVPDCRELSRTASATMGDERSSAHAATLTAAPRVTVLDMRLLISPPPVR